MSRPAGGYKNAAGKRIPGVTTITGRFKDSGALIAWANRIGLEGQEYGTVLEAAGDAGTCCHAMIEQDWHGTIFDRSKWDETVLKKADHAYLAYLEWKEQTKLTVVKPELSLVSERYQFGGTIDAVMVSGRLNLGDYKTSNGIYSDMLIQVAGGYALLWEEHYPDEPLQGMDLIRFSKPKGTDDPISFHHSHWSAEIFTVCKDQFILFRRAYELDKQIKGML